MRARVGSLAMFVPSTYSAPLIATGGNSGTIAVAASNPSTTLTSGSSNCRPPKATSATVRPTRGVV